jgi:hypothetical protein
MFMITVGDEWFALAGRFLDNVRGFCWFPGLHQPQTQVGVVMHRLRVNHEPAVVVSGIVNFSRLTQRLPRVARLRQAVFLVAALSGLAGAGGEVERRVCPLVAQRLERMVQPPLRR